ncbi:MAG: hypothetical protein WBC07_08405 [Methylotenera sp.]
MMKTIDQSHLSSNCRVQGAQISTSAWLKADNAVVNLINVRLRNTECTADIHIWPQSTDEVQALIDTLTQHIKNVQAKELESIANASEMAVAA